MSVRILLGDMRERLLELDDASIDSVITDPPYHLTSIVKRFGSKTAAPAKAGKTGAYARAARGFMGQMWDGGDIAFQPDTWREVFRVMKPGAHLLAFSGTRTYHRMVCAIEDAGFEIRDQIAWLYGSGFPKSHDVSKAIDRYNGDAREKIAVDGNAPAYQRNVGNHRPWMDNAEHLIDGPSAASAASAAWQGWGTALKPALEPIVVARKPLEGTVAANVLAHGTGALNVGGSRIAAVNGDEPLKWETPRGGIWTTDSQAQAQAQGRWPANVVHDGSDEVVAAFPETRSGNLPASTLRGKTGRGGKYGNRNAITGPEYVSNSGSAARFFYSAKADQAERHAGCEHLDKGNRHPTVKPVDLMRWLCRLVTPPGGTVLDPFAGSGSTLIAADAEQFNAIGIEMDAGYAEIARARIAHAAGLFAEVMVA